MNKHKEAEEEPLLLFPSNPKRINVGNRNPLQPFFPPILILALLLDFHQPCSAATNTIPLGSTLTASNPNQTWSSPSSTFTLHFLPLSNSYSLAITYANTIPIWIAGGRASVVDSGASFHLLSTGDLRLLNGSGTLIWHSNTSNLGITHATLDDSGNLSLLNNNSNPIWSSFDHPTDTIVQTQNFTTDMRLNSGRYSFTLNRNGNMTLMWNNSIIYWTLGLNSSSSATANLSNPSISLNNGTGEIFLSDTNLSSSVVMVTATDYAATVDLRFIKLDNDGNLRIYTAHQDSATTNPQWSAVSDQCEVFGYCGNMGVCSYNETDPICGCPSQNFEPIDSSDTRKGCRLKKSIKDYCPSNSTMLQMDHTLFLTYPPENTTDDIVHAGISPCEGNCLISSACVGATALSDGSGLCYIKTQGFVSAYQSAAIPSTSYVKVCPPVQPNLPPPVQDGDSNGSKRVEIWFVGVAILVTVLILATTEYCIWWWFCRKSRRFSMLAAAQYALLEYASGAPVQFSYRELHRATKGFSEKLGSGGFGAVYKGLLQNRTVVAVKQLEGIEQGEKQFRMEVATISSTHHLNLVRLIGFCSEGKHRLLVYEYMRNGSLDNLLFVKEGDDQDQSKVLDWENRFSILLGTAKGITYLHEECRDCIVHCDIKPENILLDESYTAKVSDFGLAKLISVKDQRYKTLTSVRGTRGYLAPEWLTNLPITSKSDVYSYGMVLLEMVSGKRNFEVSNQTNRKKFSNWAIEEFEKGNLRSIVDERMVRSGEVDMGQVERAVMVSFWCIQEQPSMRPTMGKVVQMLEGVVEIDRPLEVKVGNTDESEREGLMVVASGQNTTLVDTSAPNYPSSSSSFQYPRDPSSFCAVEVERRYTSLI